LSNTSLAHPATREARGLEIYCKHSEDIALSIRRGTYSVPGCSGTVTYAVRLVPEEWCECRDFEHRSEPCKHIYATRTVLSCYPRETDGSRPPLTRPAAVGSSDTD